MLFLCSWLLEKTKEQSGISFDEIEVTGVIFTAFKSSSRINGVFLSKSLFFLTIMALMFRCRLVYFILLFPYTTPNVVSNNDNRLKGWFKVDKDNNVEKTIGKRIQTIRKAKGYTQQQFSEMVGLSTNYFSDIERGKSSPRMDKLVAIINALGCSADDIFVDVIDTGYKVKASQLSDLVENLSPEERKRVFAVIEALLSK